MSGQDQHEPNCRSLMYAAAPCSCEEIRAKAADLVARLKARKGVYPPTDLDLEAAAEAVMTWIPIDDPERPAPNAKISVLQTKNTLQICADVDHAGLMRLQEVLRVYGDVLQLSTPKPLPPPPEEG